MVRRWVLLLAFDDGRPRRGRKQTRQHTNRRRLSRTIVPEQSGDLARIHGEVQTVDGGFHARRGLKILVQIDNVHTFVVRNL